MELLPVIYTSVAIFAIVLVIVIISSYTASKFKSAGKKPPWELAKEEEKKKIKKQPSQREVSQERKPKVEQKKEQGSLRKEKVHSEPKRQAKTKSSSPRLQVLNKLEPGSEPQKKKTEDTAEKKRIDEKNVLKSYASQDDNEFYSLKVEDEKKKDKKQ